MATVEITISDDSKLDLIVSLLKEFRYISVGKIQLDEKETKPKTAKKAKINWTDAKLDPESERLVWKCIAEHQANTPSSSPTIKEVFYDL